jgi:hypothetical protein
MQTQIPRSFYSSTFWSRYQNLSQFEFQKLWLVVLQLVHVMADCGLPFEVTMAKFGAMRSSNEHRL